MLLEDGSNRDAESFATYRSLRQRAGDAVRRGRWRDALPFVTHAWEWAIENGPEALQDRALCNLSIVKIHLGEDDGCVAQLGEVLLRTRDPESRWLASYNIARAHELDKRFDRGLFYGRIARDQARAMDREDLLAVSHNRLGNLYLGQSETGKATREYERSLELMKHDGGRGDGSLELGKILDNLGYCRVLQGRLEDGFRLLVRSWRILRSGDTLQPLISLHLDLAYAYLEVERPRHADRHARRALEYSRRLDEKPSVKNALFLLGESATLRGDEVQARRSYGQLQSFYPDLPVITDLLLAVDTRSMINLRA